jgi:hypothetical protein
MGPSGGPGPRRDHRGASIAERFVKVVSLSGQSILQSPLTKLGGLISANAGRDAVPWVSLEGSPGSAAMIELLPEAAALIVVTVGIGGVVCAATRSCAFN